MKKTMLILSIAAAIVSCNNKTAEQAPVEVPKEVAAEVPAVTYPYTAVYSSDFKMGDPELTKKVLEMYKSLEAGNFDNLGTYFSDTVHWRNFAEDDVFLTREGLVSKIKGFRSKFKEFSETPVAFMAVHSNDKGDDWVLTWIKERVTYPNGKKDSTTYQESWRFKDGKIYMHDSYAKFRN